MSNQQEPGADADGPDLLQLLLAEVARQIGKPKDHDSSGSAKDGGDDDHDIFAQMMDLTKKVDSLQHDAARGEHKKTKNNPFKNLFPMFNILAEEVENREKDDEKESENKNKSNDKNAHDE
eukprot:g732.t1